MEIKIYKSKKTLQVWDKNKLEHEFPIGIGKAGTGHKKREGDMLTPEGEYMICQKIKDTQYYRSVLLNYPNNHDALLGLQEKAISKDEFEKISHANKNHEIPLQKTALGGEICIHGELEKKDWSHGCVRMFNQDIDTIYDNLKIGTKVIIYP